jgi:hypothetical protein
MGRYTTSLYLALFNVAALGLVGLGWAYGLVGHLFSEDVSHITWVSAALLVGVIAYATWTTFRFDRMDEHDEHAIESAMAWPHFLKAKVFFNLGLCATLVGLSAFVGVLATHTGTGPEAISSILASMQTSMKTAFNGTLVGIVAKLWTDTIVFIQGWSVRRLQRSQAAVSSRGHSDTPLHLHAGVGAFHASDDQLRAIAAGALDGLVMSDARGFA